MLLFLPHAWLLVAIIVGVAAKLRGRSPIRWLLLAILVFPPMAILFLIALPDLGPGTNAINDKRLRRNIEAAHRRRNGERVATRSARHERRETLFREFRDAPTAG